MSQSNTSAKQSVSETSNSSVEMFEPVVGQALKFGEEQKDRSNHWEVRTQEQGYAFLADPDVKEENRYGQKIDLLDLTGLPENKSMFINENPEVGTNPNRNKQHGFFFTADNCIGCHACEAACCSTRSRDLFWLWLLYVGVSVQRTAT